MSQLVNLQCLQSQIMDGGMKRLVIGSLFICFLLIAVEVESKPTNGMTRIQVRTTKIKALKSQSMEKIIYSFGILWNLIKLIYSTQNLHFQEVLRTLMGGKPGLSARGKKFYNSPDSRFSSFHEPMEIKTLVTDWWRLQYNPNSQLLHLYKSVIYKINLVYCFNRHTVDTNN